MATSRFRENSPSMELAFCITLHPALGYLIEPFAVGRTPSQQFEYGFKKTGKQTYHDYFDTVDDATLQLFDILHKIADENLHKRFNPSSVKINRFYESLKKDYVEKHIRPFIDKVLYQAASHMSGHNIPLYYKGDAGERIRETPLSIPSELADAFFHFERQQDQMLYRLEVKHGGNDLFLYMKKAKLISLQPCLLLLAGNLLRFHKEWDGKKLMPFFDKEFLVIPRSAEKQFFQKFVQKTIQHHSFKAIGFKVNEIAIKPVPLLKVEEHWQGEIVMGLYFQYSPNIVFRSDDPVKVKVIFSDKNGEISFDKIIRNDVFEKELAEFLKSLHLKKIDGPFFSLYKTVNEMVDPPAAGTQDQINGIIDWLNSYHDLLHEKGVKCEKSIFNKNYHSGKYALNLQSETSNDWFDLYGTAKFGEFEIPFANLSDHILNGTREFGLPDGSIALIPEAWMSKYKDIFRFSTKKGAGLVVKKHHFTLLKSLQNDGLNIPGLDLEAAHEKHPVPPGMLATLRGYQQEGFNWMLFLKKNKLGGCLADDMGLGKTLQALALLAHTHLEETYHQMVLTDHSAGKDQRYNNGNAGPNMQLSLFDSIDEPARNTPLSRGNCSLVIMPLSLVHNWMEEIRRFVPSLRVLQHSGSQRVADTVSFDNYDLVLTTYGTVRNDVDMLEKYTFRYIILDESQVIKNASSRIFSAIKKLQSQYRLVLTGTPIENSLTDLWSQFSFMNPGMLGSLGFFKNEFVTPIERKSDERAGEKLQTLIRPFILRRTKNQVAKELPPLSQVIHYCEMTPEQEAYYEQKKSEIRNAIFENIRDRGPDKSRFFVLSGLTRLRLIANHPAMVDNSFSHDSGKYLEVKRNIDKILDEDHKVLIFSQFVKHLNLFGKDFCRDHIPYSMLTGKVTERDRGEVIRGFRRDELNRLFLISLKAGGLGLNLTEADYVFMLDPWWNPAVERQAINRAHRIGQEKNVFVYKFITRNTVEEKILKLQERKSDLAGMFINDNNPLKSLSFEELTDLIS